MENSPKVLVVEDLSITALDLRARLKRLGCWVPAVASSGEEAIRYARDVEPDVVFMDVKLKGEMDGIEAAKKISERFGIPIVFVTAFADEDTKKKLNRVHPVGIVTKPYQDEEICSAVTTAIQQPRSKND